MYEDVDVIAPVSELAPDVESLRIVAVPVDPVTCNLSGIVSPVPLRMSSVPTKKSILPMSPAPVAPKASLFVTTSGPWIRLNMLVKVFAAESVRVPVPLLPKRPPETTPEIVADFPEATLTVVLTTLIEPDSAPFSEKLMFPAELKVSGSEIAAVVPTSRVALPEIVVP